MSKTKSSLKKVEVWQQFVNTGLHRLNCARVAFIRKWVVTPGDFHEKIIKFKNLIFKTDPEINEYLSVSRFMKFRLPEPLSAELVWTLIAPRESQLGWSCSQRKLWSLGVSQLITSAVFTISYVDG
jgi:hypothetical protein